MELGCSGYVLISLLQYNSTITFHGIYMIFFIRLQALYFRFDCCVIDLISELLKLWYSFIPSIILYDVY